MEARLKISMFFMLAIVAFMACPQPLIAADRTVGIIKRDSNSYDGYTLYKPLAAQIGGPVYLINNAGNPVHKWTIPLLTRPGGEVFIRKNGELVLTTDEGFYAINPDSSVAWVIDSRVLGAGRWFGHHEVVELPNGNMLVPGFIEKTRAEAIAAGFDVSGADACDGGRPDLAKLRVDNIWELAPTDQNCGFKCGWKVVWRWNLWDHFVQKNDPLKPNYVEDLADYPGKADIGYIDPAEGTCGNWIQNAWTFGRFNALGFNPGRNEIVMSESLMNEVWIINHNTTTEEATGAAGDLIYRWGNPYAFGTGEPFVNADNRGDQKLSFQHRVQWIPQGFPGEGNILIFNNGTDWGNSSVIEVTPPLDENDEYTREPGQPFGPTAPAWQYDEYDTPGSFFAGLISSAQRLPNGNTLINNGPAGYIFEVTPQGEKVWEYINPNAGAYQGGGSFGLYRAWRYAPDYPGLAGMALVPGDPLETYPNTYDVDVLPGSCVNEVSRGSVGYFTTAILGSRDLDVKTLDPSSILLEGFPPAKWFIEDTAAPGKCKGGDKYPDLVLKYPSSFSPVALSNATIGGDFPMHLTGYSSAGWFLGRDKVYIKK